MLPAKTELCSERKLPKAWMQKTGRFVCASEEKLTDTLSLTGKSYFTNGARSCAIFERHGWHIFVC